MVAKNTKGVKICVVESGAVGTAVVPTDVSAAAPAVVTMDAAVTGMKDGDIIYIPASATGMPSLDNKSWVVSNVQGTTFELLGSDSSADTYNPADPPDLTVYLEEDMVCLCLSSLTVNNETPDSVSVGTFCDPTATIPSQVVSAGTIDFGGYVDVNEEDYPTLLNLYNTAENATFRVYLPDNGYLIFDGIVGAFGLEIPLDGALAYTGQVTLNGKPRHLF